MVLAADMNNIRDQLNATAPATLTAQGDIVIASGANALARLSKSTTSTQYLANTGTSNAPAWDEVALATGVSGTLPVGNGGTGATSLTANGILVGNSTSAIAVTATMATKGHVMIGDGSGVPSMLAVGSNDQVLTADSGEGTGVKWAAAAGGGAITREGGQTTEGTTTSTSPADLITASSLTIQLTDPFYFTVDGRKTSGTASTCALGLKINSTDIFALPSTLVGIFLMTNANAAVAGTSRGGFGSRVTNYFQSAAGYWAAFNSTTADGDGTFTGPMANTIPNAEITGITIKGMAGNSAVTVGADELQVYTEATS